MRKRILSSILPLAACSGGGGEADVPSPAYDLTCSARFAAPTAERLVQVAREASPGSCVVMTAAEYEPTEPVKVPAGVHLVGAQSVRPVIHGAVHLSSDASFGAADVSGPQGGISINGFNARLRDVTVSGVQRSAVSVGCSLNRCEGPPNVLEDVVLVNSRLAIAVRRTPVRLVRVRMTENGAHSAPPAPAGLFADEGAHVELDSVVIEKNADAAVFVRGEGTVLVARDTKVIDNDERGVWTEGLTGTLDRPSLVLEGCEIARNTMVGLGLVASRGIVVTGGRIAETRVARTITNDGPADIADGVDVLHDTGDVKLETTLEKNARAAGVVSGIGIGTVLVEGTVTADPPAYGFVVQSPQATVTIAPDATSTPGRLLGVDASPLGAPPF